MLNSTSGCFAFYSLLANTIVEAASTENIRAYSEVCRASDSIADKSQEKSKSTDTIEANFGTISGTNL